MMSTSTSPLDSTTAGPSDSPDPASHAPNIYDDEGEWLDEEDDDDMDLEDSNREGESEELEYFEATEDDEDVAFEGRKLFSKSGKLATPYRRWRRCADPRSITHRCQ